MRALDRLVKQRAPEGKRYGMDQWIQEWMAFGGHRYPLGFNTTWANEKAEPISSSFQSFSEEAFAADPIVFAVEQVRLALFSEATFKFQRFRDGRPAELFGNRSLELLENPWPQGTTRDLLARMILDADLAGNFYGVKYLREIIRLRPDWVEIVLAPRMGPFGQRGQSMQVGFERVGYFYYEGGKVPGKEPAFFLPDEVVHFAPSPDPLFTFRGMSWLTPVIREVEADKAATKHKLKFFENAATPNLAVSMAKEITPEQFEQFMDAMDEAHKGVENAYKTLYTAGGADVTVIGADMKALDFKSTQGAGETRIAAAGGVHPVVAGLSEGMQGSSLNAGNFQTARRRLADGTLRPLWRAACGALQTVVPPPRDARLWYDARDIDFLQEDVKDAAEIQGARAATIRKLIEAGFKPDDVIAAVNGEDFGLLTGKHSGLFSVQLQPENPNGTSSNTDQDNNGSEADDDDD